MEDKVDNRTAKSVASRVALFNQHAQEHHESQLINDFSHHSVDEGPTRAFAQEEYGRPPAGSASEQRARKVQVQTLLEVLQLCELIARNGKLNDQLLVGINFGSLFELYTEVSSKLLGTLLCARKHNYVQFEGELLLQGRDDAVSVCLLRPFSEMEAEIRGKIDNLRSMSSKDDHQETL